MVRPHRYSTLQKPISGYQPQVGSDRVDLMNRAVRTLGNNHCPTNRVQSRHDLIFITATDCAICFTTSAPSPIQYRAKHAPRVTPPIANATRRKTDHKSNVYSSTIATSIQAASTPENFCPHTASAMNRQPWLRQALSALTAETPSQKKQRISYSEP